MFNDPVEEIQELTYVVKRDISELNKRLELLKTLPDNRSAQSSAHSGTVVATLSSRLQGTTSSFREVLEVRTEVRQSIHPPSWIPFIARLIIPSSTTELEEAEGGP